MADNSIDFSGMVVGAGLENIEESLDLVKSPPSQLPSNLPASVSPATGGDISFIDDLLDTPGQVFGGAADALVNQGRFIKSGLDYLGEHSELINTVVKTIGRAPDVPSYPEAVGPIGSIARNISQFVTGAFGVAAKMKTANTVVRGFASSFVSGATAFPPDSENIANFVRDIATGNETAERAFSSLPKPLQNLLLVLPSVPEDSDAFNRIKNGAVEGLFGIPFDALLTAAKLFKAGREAKKLLKQDASLSAKKALIRGDHKNSYVAKKDAAAFKKLTDDISNAKDESSLQKSIQKLDDFKKKNAEAFNEGVDEFGPILGKGALKDFGIAALKPKSFEKSAAGGIFEGSEQFVTPVIVGGKPFDLSSVGLDASTLDSSEQIVAKLSKIITKIHREIKNRVPGRPLKRDEALLEFEGAMARIGEDRDLVIKQALTAGPVTPQDALAMDIIRAAHGEKTFLLMRRTLAGDFEAARLLPKQMAIGAEIEAIARNTPSPMNKEMLKQIDTSDFRFGKNVNELATNMMIKHAELVPNFDGIDLALRLNTLRTPKQYARVMQQASRPGGFDAFLEYYYNSILSGMDTIGGNFLNSHIFAIYQIPVRALAGVIGVADKAITGSKNNVALGEFAAQTYGYVRGVTNALLPLARNVGRVSMGVKPISESGLNKFEAFEREAITSEVFAPTINAVDKIMDNATRGALSVRNEAEFAVNSMGRIVRTVQNLFVTGDEFNKAVAFDMQRHAEAYRSIANSGKSPVGMNKAFKEIVEHTPKHHGSPVDFASMVTFTDEVEASAGFRDFVDTYPALRVLFPFVRSQASIFSAFVNNSPLAVFSPRFAKALKAGGAERQVALSQLMLGSTLTMAVYDGWATGRITGSGPSDAAERTMMKKGTGWQQDSFLVGGDSWITNIFNISRTIDGTVSRVVDGDTVDITDADGTSHRIRLSKVDAAEMGTFAGPPSKENLQRLLAGNPRVQIVYDRTGHYGRKVGDVMLNGVNIGTTQIDQGFAEVRPNPPVYHSYRLMEPFASHMSMIVNSLEVTQRLDDPQESDSVFRSVYENVASNLLNKQYTKGLMTIVDVLNGGRGADKIPSRLLGTLVPALAADAAKFVDPTSRDYKTIDPTLSPEHAAMVQLVNGAVSRTPGASKSLIPDYDGLGRVGLRQPSFGKAFFNIVPKSAKIDNPVFSSMLSNSYNPKKLDNEISGAKLSLEEYAEYQRLLGTVKIDGMNIMDAYRDLVAGFDPTDGDTIGPDGSQHAQLEAVRFDYKNEAEIQLIDKFPDIDRRIEEALDVLDEAFEESVPNSLLNVGDNSIQDFIGAK